MDFPIFASNFCPNAGSALGLGTLNEEIEVEGAKINPGDFFIGDESGIVVIPQELFSKTMVAALGVKVKESKIIKDIAQGSTLAEIVGLGNK
jgi:3-hexulose-6-phosphate synthase